MLFYSFSIHSEQILEESNNKEWNGENYHHYSQIQYQLAHELLKLYSFQGEEKILDVGCGDGKITTEIAAKIPSGCVVGVDKSASMIAFAQRTFGSLLFANLHFELQDAVALPYENAFDVVFSFCCLHWVKDQLAALKSIHSSLKPYGLFFAVLPYAVNNLDRATNATIEKSRWKDYFKDYVHPARPYDTEEYNQLLSAANFTPLLVRMRETTMVFDGREQLLKWLQPLLPHLQWIPTNDHRALIDDIIDTLLSQHPQALHNSGAIHIPLPVLEVKAQKLELINS